jgi:hypothetical protein
MTRQVIFRIVADSNSCALRVMLGSAGMASVPLVVPFQEASPHLERLTSAGADGELLAQKIRKVTADA